MGKRIDAAFVLRVRGRKPWHSFFTARSLHGVTYLRCVNHKYQLNIGGSFHFIRVKYEFHLPQTAAHGRQASTSSMCHFQALSVPLVSGRRYEVVRERVRVVNDALARLGADGRVRVLCRRLGRRGRSA